MNKLIATIFATMLVLVVTSTSSQAAATKSTGLAEAVGADLGESHSVVIPQLHSEDEGSLPIIDGDDEVGEHEQGGRQKRQFGYGRRRFGYGGYRRRFGGYGGYGRGYGGYGGYGFYGR